MLDMVEHPSPTVPLSDADRVSLIESTSRSDKSTQYKLHVTRAALDAPSFNAFIQSANVALSAERARILGRTPDACHTIALSPWQACDVCGATGEG